MIEKYAHMTEGTCSDQGYTVDDGTKAVEVPFVGPVNFARYTKPKEVGTNATLYRILEGECGDASIPAEYAKYVEEFAGLQEGTCSAQGYTVVDGSKTMEIPMVGDVTLSLYSKASEVDEYVAKHGEHVAQDRHMRKFLKSIRRNIKSQVNSLINLI